MSDADDIKRELQVAADALSRVMANLVYNEREIEQAKTIVTINGLDSSSTKPDAIAKILSGIMVEMSVIRRRLQSMHHEIEMWQERV